MYMDKWRMGIRIFVSSDMLTAGCSDPPQCSRPLPWCQAGEGAAGQRRQPRPLPRLEQDLADALAVQAADSIGNVRLRVQQKAAAAAAEGGARSSKAVVGRRGKLRVQARAPLFAATCQDTGSQGPAWHAY